MGGDHAPLVAEKAVYRAPGPVETRERKNNVLLAFVNFFTLFWLEIFAITLMPLTAIDRHSKD